MCGKVPHLAGILFLFLIVHQYPCDEGTRTDNSPFLWHTWKVTSLKVGSEKAWGCRSLREESVCVLAWFRGTWATIKEAECVLGFYWALFAAWAAQLIKCEREERSTNWKRYYCIERIKCGGWRRSKTHFLHSTLTWNLNKRIWKVIGWTEKIALLQKKTQLAVFNDMPYFDIKETSEGHSALQTSWANVTIRNAYF